MADEIEPPSKSASEERGTLASLAEVRLGPVTLNLRILLEPIGFVRIILLVSQLHYLSGWCVAAATLRTD